MPSNAPRGRLRAGENPGGFGVSGALAGAEALDFMAMSPSWFWQAGGMADTPVCAGVDHNPARCVQHPVGFFLVEIQASGTNKSSRAIPPNPHLPASGISPYQCALRGIFPLSDLKRCEGLSTES